MKKLILALLILSGIPLCAQTTTTYTGTIKDLTGATVTSGRITWALNAPSGGVIPGTGAFVSSTVSCLINASGAPVSSSDGVSACVITNNTALTPTGTSYALCIQPYNVTPGSCFVTYATGGTVNISNLVPTSATQPNYGVASTQIANTWQVSQTFSQGFTIGSSYVAATLAALGGLSTAVTTPQTMAGALVTPAVTTPLINSLQSPEYVNTAHPPLAFWDAVFHNCQNQVVNIQIHGDSRSIIDTTVSPGSGSGSTLNVTFGSKWADQLETLLAQQCGNHGGVKPLRWGTGTFATQGLNQDYYSFTGSLVTTDTALGPYQPNTSDPMLVTANANGTIITFVVPYPFDHLATYCVTGPGLNAWTMKIDGSSVGTCGGTGGSKVATLATSSAVALGPHTATLTCTTQPCEAYAMQATAGTTGIEVDNLSVGGASAELFGLAPSTQYAFSDLIPGQPALDIIYEISNEPGQGYSTTQFQTTLNSMIAHDQTHFGNQPSIMIFSPLQDGIGGQGPYYPILAATAAAQNTAFMDLRDRWGTALAPSYLFGPDGIHESNQGNGEVFSAIAQTIIDVQPKPWQFVVSNPVTNNGGFIFREAGLNNFACTGLGTGNTGNVNVMGCVDATTGVWIWNTNASDDFCVGESNTVGAACTNAQLHVIHATSEVDTRQNQLDDGSGNMGAAGTFHANAGIVGIGTDTYTWSTGAGTTTATSVSCFTGFTCDSKGGLVAFTTTTGPVAGGATIVTITLGGQTRTQKAMCWAKIGNTSGVDQGPFWTGSSTTTTLVVQNMGVALAAATPYLLQFGCN